MVYSKEQIIDYIKDCVINFSYKDTNFGVEVEYRDEADEISPFSPYFYIIAFHNLGIFYFHIPVDCEICKPNEFDILKEKINIYINLNLKEITDKMTKVLLENN
jgi:hypothetical protein